MLQENSLEKANKGIQTPQMGYANAESITGLVIDCSPETLIASANHGSGHISMFIYTLFPSYS